MSLTSKLVFAAYRGVTAIIAPLGMAFLIHKKRRDPPYGARKWELLGFTSKSLEPGAVIFHAVSVGEVIAAKPVIERFASLHPELKIIVTTTTTTGAAQAQKIKGISHLFCPLDSPCAVRRFFKAVKPQSLFIMETELWPNLLAEAKKRGVFTAVFNARMPEKTCVKYEKHAGLVKNLIADPLSLVICQSSADAQRFARIGVSKSRLKVANSLKYDLSPDEGKFKAARALKEKLRLSPVLGALSTHDGEEQQVLETFFEVRKEHPELKLLLVPRHQSGTDKAVQFLTEHKELFTRRSQSPADLSELQGSVLIGDTFGEMEFYLGLCDLVFMGGSLVDIGGHNPLEPAYFSLPIITGPYYYNFAEQFEKLLDKEGAFLAQDRRKLAGLIKLLLEDPDKLSKSGIRALDVQQQGKGAVRITVQYLEETLGK